MIVEEGDFHDVNCTADSNQGQEEVGHVKNPVRNPVGDTEHSIGHLTPLNGDSEV